MPAKSGTKPKPTKAASARKASASPSVITTQPPPVDMGPLPELIGYLLRRAQLVVFQDFIRTFDEVGIRPAQFSVLTIIQRNPGLKQSEVSAALGIKRTNFVALLDSLEKRGLAKRMPTPSDRRSYALFLTPEGEKLMTHLNQLVEQHEERQIARLGRENRDEIPKILQEFLIRTGDATIDED